MKLLSIVIPSYNSERYLKQCLESLLVGHDEELDVIVVNDGSTDNTSKLAHEFADKHPFVRVIDKDNAGHGSGVNIGMDLATGLYFKILDSDDLLDREGLIHLLELMKKNHESQNDPDLYLADYRSYPEGDDSYNTQISFLEHMKKLEEVVGWDGLPRIKFGDFFMIHMCYVRTAVLKENNVHLLERTFYEDNQFMFLAIKYSNTLCYSTLPVYKYTVGRKGQSISLENMAKKYEHQHRVLHEVIDSITFEEYKKMNKHLKWHIRHDLFKMSMLNYFYTYIAKGKERHRKYKSLFRYFKKSNPKMYHIWKYRTSSILLWIVIPALRHTFMKIGYNLFAEKKGWK